MRITSPLYIYAIKTSSARSRSPLSYTSRPSNSTPADFAPAALPPAATSSLSARRLLERQREYLYVLLRYTWPRGYKLPDLSVILLNDAFTAYYIRLALKHESRLSCARIYIIVSVALAVIISIERVECTDIYMWRIIEDGFLWRSIATWIRVFFLSWGSFR